MLFYAILQIVRLLVYTLLLFEWDNLVEYSWIFPREDIQGLETFIMRSAEPEGSPSAIRESRFYYPVGTHALHDVIYALGE